MSAVWTGSRSLSAGAGASAHTALTIPAPLLLTTSAAGVTQLLPSLLGTGGEVLGGGCGLLRRSRPRGAVVLSAAAPCAGAPLGCSEGSEVRPLLGQLVQLLRGGGERQVG